MSERVLKIARGWVGRKESDGSHKEIIDVYNGQPKPLPRNYRVKATDAWCATFVSACFIKAGLAEIMPTECGCGEMIKLHQAKGIFNEDDNHSPSPGCIVFYDWDDHSGGKGNNRGWPDHVGIVEKVDGDKIIVIEGNMNNAVGRRTIQRGQQYIRGYSCPVYPKTAPEAPQSWAKASWEKAFAKGIMDGNRPHDPLTREELSVVLDRLGLL